MLGGVFAARLFLQGVSFLLNEYPRFYKDFPMLSPLASGLGMALGGSPKPKIIQ